MRIIREAAKGRVTRRGFIQTASAFAITVLSRPWLYALSADKTTATSLSTSFLTPLEWAKPYVQYWWNPKIKKEDITNDLEAMHKQGIGGALLWPDRPTFEAGNRQELMELLEHALKEADRLGMDMNIKPMQGESTMAGEWIDHEHALKSPTWAEIDLTGPKSRFRIDLKPKIHEGFYRDVAVLAYKTRPAVKRAPNYIQKAGGKITGSPVVTNADYAVDGDPTTGAIINSIRLSAFTETLAEMLPIPYRDPKWIACEFPEPYTASAVAVCVANHMDMPTELELQSSEDGKVYKTICQWHAHIDEPTPVSFKETRSRFYRLVVSNNNKSELRPFIQIKFFDLLKDGDPSSWPRIDHWMLRTGLGMGVPWYDPEVLDLHATRVPAEQADLAVEDVIDLTNRIGADNALEWDVPAGDWRILRFGYTLAVFASMVRNDKDQWYFCDVLSKEAAEVAFNGLPKKMLESFAPHIGKSFKLLHEDSWELEENSYWTPNFVEEFQHRRGYDPRRYLPAMAGSVVGDGETTDRFLWDYRRTVADMVADNYVATLTDLCRKNGVEWHSEIPAGYMPSLLDSLRLHSRAGVISGEFWARNDEEDPKSAFMEVTSRRFCDAVVTAASAAHTGGKQIVDAESFTHFSHGYEKDPFSFKDIGDRALCRGINRMSFLGYPSQDETSPGWSFSFFCDDWNRHNTWWEQSHAWFGYVARCQFLLQQGLYQADLCYLNSETIPSAVPGREYMQPAMPDGYSYDGCSAEVVRDHMTVKDGRLVLPDGMNYRVLVLPERDLMTPETLRKVSELVQQGATVVGPKPKASPSLANYPECDREVQKIANKVWADCDGKTVLENNFGKGRVVWGKKLAEVLSGMEIGPDFDYTSRPSRANVMYIHKKIGNDDIYFVSNQQNEIQELDCRFRITGKLPELWFADTGKVVRQGLYQQAGQHTLLPLRLDPRGSVFVVFRENAPKQRVENVKLNGKNALLNTTTKVTDRPVVEVQETSKDGIALSAWEGGTYLLKMADGRDVTVPVPKIPQPLAISGAWEVRFGPGLGAPESISFSELLSWTEHDNPDIKFFSGSATYVKEIQLEREIFADNRNLFLDLGRVRNLAEVKINGKVLGLLWKPSFRLDITDATKPGTNLVEVKVTNLWPNRLIGDQALPQDQRRAPTDMQHYPQGWPLYESGLLGPVQIRFVERRKIGASGRALRPVENRKR
jgi:hypothetical protein